MIQVTDSNMLQISSLTMILLLNPPNSHHQLRWSRAKRRLATLKWFDFVSSPSLHFRTKVGKIALIRRKISPWICMSYIWEFKLNCPSYAQIYTAFRKRTKWSLQVRSIRSNIPSCIWVEYRERWDTSFMCISKTL